MPVECDVEASVAMVPPAGPMCHGAVVRVRVVVSVPRTEGHVVVRGKRVSQVISRIIID